MKVPVKTKLHHQLEAREAPIAAVSIEMFSAPVLINQQVMRGNPRRNDLTKPSMTPRRRWTSSSEALSWVSSSIMRSPWLACTKGGQLVSRSYGIRSGRIVTRRNSHQLDLAGVGPG